MITENLSTLKIHKLTQEQYDRELAAGTLDANALYLTPEEEIDLSGYATVEQLNEKLSITDTAAKATADASGNIITDTYATKTEVPEAVEDYLSDLGALTIDLEGSTEGLVAGIDADTFQGYSIDRFVMYNVGGGDGEDIPSIEATSGVSIDLESAEESGQPVIVDADTLGGKLPEHYAKASSSVEIIEAGSADYDMDVIFKSGRQFKIYRTNIDTLNTPYQAGLTGNYTGANIITATASEDYGKQIAFINGGSTYERALSNGDISEWKRIVNTGAKISEEIWTNASPTSTFLGQTSAWNSMLTNLKNYDFFIVRFRFSTSSVVSTTMVVLPNGTAHRAFTFGDVVEGSAVPCIYTRAVTINSDSIVFGGCYKNPVNSTSSSTENSYLIPVNIYGIKIR